METPSLLPASHGPEKGSSRHQQLTHYDKIISSFLLVEEHKMVGTHVVLHMQAKSFRISLSKLCMTFRSVKVILQLTIG